MGMHGGEAANAVLGIKHKHLVTEMQFLKCSCGLIRVFNANHPAIDSGPSPGFPCTEDS